MDARWKEIESIHREYRGFYQFFITTVLIGAGILIGFFLASYLHFEREIFAGLFPEALSITFTIVVLNRLAERRQQRTEMRRLKSDLVARLGSSVSHESKRAFEELKRYEWLNDGTLEYANLAYSDLAGVKIIGGTLQGANLEEANLANAILAKSDLSNTNLHLARLTQAILNEANLQNARLRTSDLTKAKLIKANLQGTNLHTATLIGCSLDEANLMNCYCIATDFKQANLQQTDLRGAQLHFANLEDANLNNALFDSTTKLPDGTMWRENTDLRRFTDRQHPKFWRSNDKRDASSR